jgi:hypothetical protein
MIAFEQLGRFTVQRNKHTSSRKLSILGLDGFLSPGKVDGVARLKAG